MCCPSSLRSSKHQSVPRLRPRRNVHLLKQTSMMINIFHKKAVESSQRSNGNGLLNKLKYIKEMMLGVDLVVVMAAASFATYFVSTRVGADWLSFISESKPFISTAGAFYSFALVFRTNICYSRW